ncbi:MAG: hypothetical protein WCA10_12890, partial [Terracidiphilus sp.]
ASAFSSRVLKRWDIIAIIGSRSRSGRKDRRMKGTKTLRCSSGTAFATSCTILSQESSNDVT